jgi:hypothetical protein
VIGRNLVAFRVYNAGVRRAVLAYAADECVRAGFCAMCRRNRVNLNFRKCQACTRAGRTEVPR